MTVFTLARDCSTLDLEFLPGLVGEQIGEVLHDAKILQELSISQRWRNYTPQG
jgi:hypothetical protein